MRLLAIETATPKCSVALMWDGRRFCHESDEPRRHAERVLPWVDELLGRVGGDLSGLDALVVGRGPGSFTGVRVAVAVVQGLALAGNLPIVPVSTLAALARGAWECHGASRVLAAIDARMSQVYWCACRCDENGWIEAGSERLSAPEQVVVPWAGEAWFAAGSAWQVYAQRLPVPNEAEAGRQACDGALAPHARYLLPLAERALAQGDVVTAEALEPVYLRDQVTKPALP